METPEQYTVKTPEKFTIVGSTETTILNEDGQVIFDASCLEHTGLTDFQYAKKVTALFASASELIKENERLREENKELRDRLHTANNQCQGLLSKQADDFVKMYKPFKEENKLYREALTKASNFISVFLTKMPDRLIPSDWTDAMFAGVKEMNSVLSKFQPKKDESHDEPIKER